MQAKKGCEAPDNLYRTLGDKRVVCTLCPQACALKEGESGKCRVRFVKGNKLHTANYGEVTALALDPMEKKPLYHFYPGSLILSVGTIGCNLACRFCQNWEIAQKDTDSDFVSPEELVAMAVKYRARGNIGLAFTYSEPLVWYEYIYDAAKLAKQAGLKNVLVTNGFINPGPLQELLPYIDAANLDIKGWTDRFYEEYCAGRVGPVLETAKIMAAQINLEITNLIIPGANDSAEEIKELTCFVASLGRKIPLHFSRYFPQYQMDLPPTPILTLEQAYRIAKEELDYVYVGNVADGRFSRTDCPECGQIWVERTGYSVRIKGLREGYCKNCGRQADLEGVVL